MQIQYNEIVDNKLKILNANVHKQWLCLQQVNLTWARDLIENQH